MATSQFDGKLNLYRRLGEPLGIKGIRRSVVIRNNPSTIDNNRMLTVRFPNLGPNDAIVPGRGTSLLSFNITLTSTDVNRTIVQNIGRAILRQL